MNNDYLNGGHGGSEYDHRTTGRWSREEHEKFIEGIQIFKRYIYICLVDFYKKFPFLLS